VRASGMLQHNDDDNNKRTLNAFPLTFSSVFAASGGVVSGFQFTSPSEYLDGSSVGARGPEPGGMTMTLQRHSLSFPL
jgi:hypothetical protein